MQQPLDLGPQPLAVDTVGQLQGQEGIVEGEAGRTTAPGQSQQLVFEARQGPRFGGSHRLLQHPGLVGLLHQTRNQQQIDQLTDAQQPEAQQPEAAADGLAAIEAMDAVEPRKTERGAEETQGPEQIGHGHAAALREQRPRQSRR